MANPLVSLETLFAAGYAIPAYTITYPPYCYKYRDKFLQSNHLATVELPGVPFLVAKLEDVSRG